ncbi:MAG: rhodanese-like domain-containing protein [bacterium]|nr:rhodanese-like domain-containing protein [bacterium]
MPRTWSGATSPAARPPLQVAARQALLLLLLGVALAAVRWAAWPPRLPLAADPTVYELELSATLVEVDQARRHFDEGLHLFIDTREHGTGSPETIPGALSLRPDTFDDDLLALLDIITPEDRLVLYGDGNLAVANNIAARLVQRGYQNVALLKGGLAAWRASGGPVSPRPDATATEAP